MGKMKFNMISDESLFDLAKFINPSNQSKSLTLTMF